MIKHRRTEEALLQSEEKYRDLFENANDAICIVDSDLNYKDVNKKATEMFGYSKEELLSKSILDVIPREQIPRSKIEFDKLRKKGSYEKFIGKARTKDGRLIDVEVSSSAIIVNNKNIGSRDIIRDITERKQAEESLQRSEERYRRIVDTAQEGIWVLDAEAKTSYVNQRMADMLGYTIQEMLGRSLFDFMDDTARIEAKRYFERRKQGIKERHDFRFRHKDGSDLWAIVSANPIFDESGQLIGALGMIIDVTERRRTEEALRESEERYRKLVELSPDAIIVHSEGKIVFSNTAAVKLLGAANPEQLIGQKAIDFIHPDYREMVSERIRQMREEGKDAPIAEEKIIRLDGSILYAEVAAMSFNYRGKPGMQVIIRDITKRKRAEEELLKFKLGIERSDEAIFITDINGTIIYTNPAFENVYGYSREDALGKTPRILKSGVLPPEVYKRFWDILLAKKVVSGEIINKTKDGRLINTESSANPILNENGDIIGFLAIQRDITERKRAEEELKIKAQLLDTATDSIFVHDLVGDFIYLNETAYKSRGFSKDEMIRMNLHSIVTPEYASLIDLRIKELLEKGSAVFESAHFNKGGSIIPVEAHARIIESDGKKLILCVDRDITERKQAEMMFKERARAELYGFIVSALPVFASGVPSHVRDILVRNFAERFEKNIRPRFEEEMKQLSYRQKAKSSDIEGTQEVLDIFMLWLTELFSNFGIQTKIASMEAKRDLEFLNCPWTADASGNPIFCFICRAIMIRSFTWTSLKGNVDQKSSIANGSKTCTFEINILKS